MLGHALPTLVSTRPTGPAAVPMSLPAIFDARQPADVADLVRRHPLAWVVSLGEGGLLATPLPLLAHRDDHGHLVRLEGHFSRANPQVAALRADPHALLLWLGPQGYVSPSWMADRAQAPSWNYASAQCKARLRFVADDDPAAVRAHLQALSAAHEAGRPQAWQVDELGERYAALAARVAVFHAEPLSLRGRFKLGQDERADVYHDILAGLRQAGEQPLCEWMQRFNPQRPDRDTT